MRRVVKLGGSLLARDDLITRLPQFLSQLSAAANEPVETLLVVGGGELVEAIRSLDRIRPGDPETIHWICVDLMETTTDLVRGWFPNWKVVGSPEELQTCISTGFGTDLPTFVSASSFYHRGTDSALPTDWRTTSDSIAAQLSIEVDADELVLLKSCNVDPRATIEELVTAGIVDETMPMIAAGIRHLRVQKL